MSICTRTCRSCAASFRGGPRAWYCPDCRAERRRESNARLRARYKAGTVRHLGSIDKCEICGGDYIVNGSLQRYCRECAPGHLVEVDNAQGRAYYHEHATKINRRKLLDRRSNLTTCAVCGKEFYAGTRRKTCSQACARKAKADYMRERYGIPHICCVCGAKFETKTRRNTCSEECQRTKRRRLDAEWRVKNKKD